MSNYLQFAIFLNILDGKMHTAQEIAEKLEVSTKTIYRNTNKLIYAGLPITTATGKNGGILLTKKFYVNTWFFSKEELDYMLDILSTNKTINPITNNIITNKIVNHLNFIIKE